MNKEEILKKAQKEKRDERETQIRDFAFRWTYLTGAIAAAFFSYYRAARGQPTMDLCATVCFSVCAGMLYRFVKAKEKSCLFFAVVSFAVACTATVRFFMGY
jgi:hypothetical protein